MKIIKSQLLFVLFLLVGSGFIFAQNIRYVMYFPTNNLSHKNASSRKAYFWNSIQVNGKFVVDNLNTEKDLTLESPINTINFPNTVFVGYGRNIVDESGRFVAIGRKVSSSSISHLNQINASSELSVNKIKWDSYTAFPVSGTSTIPSTYTELCWCPLRIKGTYEYRNYLVACNGNCH